METSRLAPNVANLAMPRGRISFSPLDDDGVMKGEIDLGNCVSLEFSTGLGFKEHMTSHDTIVVLDAKKISEIKPTLKIVPEERSRENMAMFFLGDPDKQKGVSPDVLSQAGAHLNAVGLTIFTDRWIQLKASGGVKDAKYVKPGSIILTIGYVAIPLTDLAVGTYRVDYENGMIMIMSNNAVGVDDGDSVMAEYRYGTCSLPKFTPRIRPLQGMLRYRGTSEVGPRHHIKFWKVQIQSDSALKLIDATNYAGLGFSGDVFLDDDTGTHGSDPFYEMSELTAATSYPS